MYKRFLTLLEDRNEKPSDVAKATGMNPTVFTDWKKGKSVPKMDKLKLIADHFGVSLDYLCYGEESSYYTNEETNRIAQDIFENRELKALFDLAADSEPEDIEAAYSVLLALKKKGNK